MSESWYINTHYLHDEIISFLKKENLENLVIVLHEEVLLDSGGAIHNLAIRDEVDYKGTILLVNGDQFLFFDKKYWFQAIEKTKNSRAVLFGIKVNADSAYNKTIVKNGQLIEIIKNTDKNQDYETYSGLGLLNLEGLKKVNGISKFFETVADFKNERIEFITPEVFEYWDFGTAEIYAKNIFKILDNENLESEMINFLKINNALNGNKETFVDKKNCSIDLDMKSHFHKETLFGCGISQQI